MRILSRAILREILWSALLGTCLFTFVLFLQKLGSGKLFETLIRGAASPGTILYLLALVIPPALVFAIPVGVLVGVLIGLGRMSSDGEITAMRAAGIPSRRVIAPVLALAAGATLLTAAASLWLNPWAWRESVRVLNGIIAQQLTAEIQPRVFEEQFTSSNKVLYVGDVIPTSNSVVRWRNVFIADLTPPDQRTGQAHGSGDAPAITVAQEALAYPDPARNSIQLSMTGVSSYEVDADQNVYHSTSAPASIQVLEARPRASVSAKAYVATDTLPLLRERDQSAEAKIELHQRFALPLACLLLAIVGIPLGVSSRKSGKSAAFVLTVFLAFLYYMALIGMISLAKQGKLPAELAVWTPDAVFAIGGIFLLAGLDRPGDRDLLSRAKAVRDGLWEKMRSTAAGTRLRASGLARMPRLPMLPGVIDTYVLGTFLFWFAVLLASFVMMAHVFIFFELLGDVLARGIPMSRVFTYHFFLTPKLIYDSAPMSVLVAVLVTFGLLAKSNEVTAMKACGVSIFRLSVPVIVASMFLSAALFAFDHYYIPEANRIQDGILNEIKGRPVQTYLRPDRKWILGEGSRIYYYKYLDPDQKLMIGVHVYELDPKTFRLRRHITAESARWEPSLQAWVFTNGWYRNIEGVVVKDYTPFQARTFPELAETPNYFLQERKQDAQLNFIELRDYIGELRRSGFDTVRLSVQLQRKFSVPAFVLIMALIALPFAFLTGSRGATAGVGVSFGIAIAYYVVSKLFEEVGNVNQLPAVLAAWSPDVVFSLAGMYLFTRIRS